MAFSPRWPVARRVPVGARRSPVRPAFGPAPRPSVTLAEPGALGDSPARPQLRSPGSLPACRDRLGRARGSLASWCIRTRSLTLAAAGRNDRPRARGGVSLTGPGVDAPARISWKRVESCGLRSGSGRRPCTAPAALFTRLARRSRSRGSLGRRLPLPSCAGGIHLAPQDEMLGGRAAATRVDPCPPA